MYHPKWHWQCGGHICVEAEDTHTHTYVCMYVYVNEMSIHFPQICCENKPALKSKFFIKYYFKGFVT